MATGFSSIVIRLKDGATVVVVVRTSGRGAALAALDAIDSLDNLRLLAREQRLSVGNDVSSVAEMRAAIVTAAERRIANRMAAAG